MEGRGKRTGIVRQRFMKAWHDPLGIYVNDGSKRRGALRGRFFAFNHPYTIDSSSFLFLNFKISCQFVFGVFALLDKLV